ncbi:DNA-binding protein [Salinicola peritrichatus]|uniref:DNA-binding protein n=1 Tax=Salinicola peritrichatus TaxID=1267424 RepID=UPI0013A60514|nr:DNA-binding protein [Salinicola peritrichatus]
MARNGIRYDDVCRAIDTLRQRGEAVSVQKVRELLGTGSYTTISDHLREWRLRQDGDSVQAIPRNLERPEALEGWIADIWDKAQQAAYEKLAIYRQQADDQIREADESRHRAQRQCEDAEQRLEALNEHMLRVQERLEAKTTEAAHLQAELQSFKSSQAQQQKRVAQLEQTCQRHQQSLEQAEKQHREAMAKQQQAHQAKLAQEEKRHESAESRLMELLDDARQERLKQEKQYEQRLSSLDQRCERLQLDLSEQRRQYGQLQESQRADKIHMEKLESEKRVSDDRLRAIQQEKQRLEAELKNLRAANRELHDRLSRAALPPTAV